MTSRPSHRRASSGSDPFQRFISENFSPESSLLQVAEAYALDAVDFAQANFRLALDWRDECISSIGEILKVFHDQLAAAKPDEETIFSFAKMFGSYVGEVYRRNHGATWGMVGMQDQEFPGLKADKGDTLFWPWGKVHNRLVNGPEDNNVWHYYQVLLRDG